MNLSVKGLQAFEADQARLETFCEQNGARVVDDVRHVLKITDRLYFNKRMTELLERQSYQIRSMFKMPASVEF